jgi:hypothetical protein
MEAQGWLPPHSRVLDVFGGIGSTAIEGASRGHEVVCIELEERFVKLALENFQLHRRVWEQSGDPLPVILHGDSRKAVELVRGHFAGCVGSPPFGERRDGQGIAIDGETTCGRRLGRSMLADAAIGSPPYAETSPESNSKSIDRTKQFESYRKAGGGASFITKLCRQNRIKKKWPRLSGAELACTLSKTTGNYFRKNRKITDLYT